MKPLPQSRKSSPKRRKSREHLVAKLNVLGGILEKLERDENADLDNVERFEIREMLKMALGGVDVRKMLGIKPRRGATPKNKVYGIAVATHYYVYCDTEVNEKTAASKVARDWDLSLPAVRRIAGENRVAYLAWMSTYNLSTDTPELAQRARDYLKPWIHSAIQTYR